jgi:hypothetical protein
MSVVAYILTALTAISIWEVFRYLYAVSTGQQTLKKNNKKPQTDNPEDTTPDPKIPVRRNGMKSKMFR